MKRIEKFSSHGSEIFYYRSSLDVKNISNGQDSEQQIA